MTRESEALRAATVDLAEHRIRVHRLADVLRAGQLDDLDQAKLGVHVDHGAVCGEGVLHVREALPGLRVQRVRAAGAATPRSPRWPHRASTSASDG